MSTTLADHQVLYGILAWQLGFVSHNDLTSAFVAWITQKSEPLGDLLSCGGKLSSEARDLLDALVDEHLKLHGGSAEQSLAALSSIGPMREELATLNDVDVNATLARCRSSTDHSTTMSAPLDKTAGGERDRFRVLRPHAKGGLGQVSLATDTQLAREVAFKELQSRFADDPHNRARFVQEAKITGGLEHPGIVPVYGAGHYADGRPYYAMRFIRGDSLHEAIEQFHRLRMLEPSTGNLRFELRKLLQRFTDVCDAIEYAHSRGVLHRDLKPGNIMLGRYGETLVVDWGLAKSIRGVDGKQTNAVHSVDGGNEEEDALIPASGSGSMATRLGTAVGTPAYMSPEQAAGRIDALGPTSDVYSLGATLYTLLTGRAPYEGETRDVLSDVQDGHLPAPRNVNPAIAKPLAAICLKAMALSPRDRYPTPRKLADEIERWLADESVSAYEESLVERIARWARRNKAVASIAALALLASLIVGSLMIYSSWHNARVARLAQTQAERAEVVSRELSARIEMEIDECIQQLVLEAGNPELLELIEQYSEPALLDEHKDEIRSDFQRWLASSYATPPQADLPFDSSLIQLHDGRGSIVAKQPPATPISQRGYAYRDYFHGRGARYEEHWEKDEERFALINPLQAPHISFPYDGELGMKVAMSVPIWPEGDRESVEEPLGVLVATIGVADIASAVARKSQSLLAEKEWMIVSTQHSPAEEGTMRRGRIIFHSVMQRPGFPKESTDLWVEDRVLNTIDASNETSQLMLNYTVETQNKGGLIAALQPIDSPALRGPTANRETDWWLIVIDQP